MARIIVAEFRKYVDICSYSAGKHSRIFNIFFVLSELWIRLDECAANDFGHTQRTSSSTICETAKELVIADIVTK